MFDSSRPSHRPGGAVRILLAALCACVALTALADVACSQPKGKGKGKDAAAGGSSSSEEVRKESPRVGYATVYRTLKLLVEHGFANPRHFDDGQTRFDPQFFKEQHDHLICVDCRRILEFDNEEIVDRIHTQAQHLGFTVTRRSLEIYGTCNVADCPHRPA